MFKIFITLAICLFLISKINASEENKEGVESNVMMNRNTRGMFERVCGCLEESSIPYKVVEHGIFTSSAMLVDILSKSTGTQIELSQGAKSMITVAPSQHKEMRDEIYTLVVLPGDETLDFKELANLLGTSAKKTRLASPEKAEELTGCVVGTVPPFLFFNNRNMQLFVDNSLIAKNANREIFFTPGCLDRSIFLKLEDYLRVSRPRLVDIVRKITVASFK